MSRALPLDNPACPYAQLGWNRVTACSRSAMADAGFAAIEALQNRVRYYTSKGKLMNAAEAFAEATRLARCLPGSPADSLIVATMQMMHGCVLATQSKQMYLSLAARTAYWKKGFCDYLLPALAKISRRFEAGTLLPGRCADVEEAWFVTQAAGQLDDESNALRCSNLHEWRQLVGLEALHLGAYYMLQFVIACPRSSPEIEALLFSSPQAFDLVVLALDTMMLQRPLDGMALVGELGLATTLSSFDVTLPVSERICKAWDRVKRSGVVEKRRLLNGSSMFDGDLADEIKSVMKAAHTRVKVHGLRLCALESCGAHEAHTSHFKCCAACKLVAYCCREHQIEAWPGHKAACKAATLAGRERAATNSTEDGSS